MQSHDQNNDAQTSDDTPFDNLLNAFDDAHSDDELGAEAHAPSGVEESLESRLLESNREVLRARAELENFRKRMQRDSDQQLKYANVPLIRDLVEVVDNLSRATEAAQQDSANTSALRDGVTMVLNQLGAVLGKFGCKRIESVGFTFDPNIHEAIAQMPSDEYAVGMVAQEVAAGYMLQDRVVRPSSVIVSTGKAS